MRKIIFGLLLAILLVASVALPIQAQPPVYEDWEFFSARNHTTWAYFTINTTNLKVESFTLINYTEMPTVTWLLILYDRTDVVLSMEAHQGEMVTEPISNFFWRRIPATDPDDPNSIRMPNKITQFCGNHLE